MNTVQRAVEDVRYWVSLQPTFPSYDVRRAYARIRWPHLDAEQLLHVSMYGGTVPA